MKKYHKVMFGRATKRIRREIHTRRGCSGGGALRLTVAAPRDDRRDKQ